jgi:hypothetical protein
MSMPSGPAVKYLRDLMEKKVVPAGAYADRLVTLLGDIEGGVDNDTAGRCSRAIDWLKGQSWKPREGKGKGGGGRGSDITAPGVFMLDHVPYVVRWTRRRGGEERRLYACELVELTAGEGDRSDETGGRVRFRHEYRPGLMRTLREEHRVEGPALEELMNRYCQCIMCGIWLKLWTSQNQLDPAGNRVMMGDTCYENAFGRKPDHKASKAAAAASAA